MCARWIIALILSWSFSAATVALAAAPTADIYLREGNERLHGAEVILLLDGKLHVTTKHGGKPTFELAEIAQIVFEGGRREARGIVLESGVVSARPVAFHNGEWSFVLASGKGRLETKETVYSINIERPEAPTRLDALSVWVLEYIYDHDPWTERKKDNWTLDIEKVTFTEQELMIQAKAFSADPKVLNSPGCRLWCMATDNDKRTYGPISDAYFKVGTASEKTDLEVKCPKPDATAESVSLSLRTGKKGTWVHPTRDNAQDMCSKSNHWVKLPAISLDILKY